VRIAQHGRDPVVATRNHLMFYNQHQTYRRTMVSEQGDHCSFLMVSPALLEEVARFAVPELVDPEVRPFPAPSAPADVDGFQLQRLLLRHLRRFRLPDELAVQECVFGLVTRSATLLFRSGRRSRPVAKPGTRRRHAELVEEAKALLAANLDAALSLDEIGHRLFVSPFHLARVFRAGTGWGLHEFRDHLRARTSFDLLDSPARLTDIASTLGYTTPGHFTDAFRRRFGVPPSDARRWLRGGQLPLG
jgi:methylphosphotriester-DNA--protein-cysteine methyltransferase